MSGAAARTGFLRKEVDINCINKEGCVDLLPTKQISVGGCGVLKKKRNVGYIKINRTGGDHGILTVYIDIEE